MPNSPKGFSNTELEKFMRNEYGILIKPLKGEVFGLSTTDYIRIGMARKEKLKKLIESFELFINPHSALQLEVHRDYSQG
ncbi:MAG: hypothetical protein HC907_37170 [Richelia sp. SM1_7_0]|nr:hypothetical protein [Richelia sp. SM1_7_0]